MRDLTLKEILEYAASIEKESFNFYTNALKVAEEGKVKDLLNKLANAEIGHLNKIELIMKEKITSKKELERTFNTDDKYITELIQVPELKKGLSLKEILELALGREEKTFETYSMFLSLTNLHEDAIKLFEDLKEQEKQHVEIITKKLNSL